MKVLLNRKFYAERIAAKHCEGQISDAKWCHQGTFRDWWKTRTGSVLEWKQWRLLPRQVGRKIRAGEEHTEETGLISDMVT